MSDKPRIGLVGYYGFGNYGDELFRHVLADALPGCDVGTAFQYKDDGTIDYDGIAARVAEFDVVLIGGGDLVIPYAMSNLYWRDEFLAKPIVIYGVGVPKWGGYQEDVVLRTRNFFQHDSVRRIVARDDESQEWIAKYLVPKVEVESKPDIVCAYTPPIVAPEPRTFGLVLRYQSTGLDATAVRTCLDVARAHGFHCKIIVMGTGKTRADDLKTVVELDPGPVDIIVRDTEAALTQELLKCSRIASMKFHGCVVAMVHGIPTLALSSANKFRNFYLEVDRTAWVSGLTDENLVEKLEAVLNAPCFAFPESIRSASNAALEELDGYLRGIVPPV